MIEQIRQVKPAVAVTVGPTATQIVGTVNRRFEAIIQNAGSANIRIGTTSQLALTGGVVLAAGEIYRHTGHGPCYGIAASGTVPVVALEVTGPGNGQDISRESTVSVGTSPVAILKRDMARHHAVIENTDAAGDLYLGNRNVSAVAGIRLAAGKQLDFYGGAAIYGISGSGTLDARVVEEGRR